MPTKHQASSQPKSQFREDEWLNDVGPVDRGQFASRGRFSDAPVSRPQREIQPPSRYTPVLGSIYLGHPLWPIVQRFSENIWREIYSTSQRPNLTRREIAEFVRKRVVDLLHADPRTAHQIRDLAEATVVLHTIVNEIVGLGPLEVLLQDERVSAIIVLGPRRTYVERDGILEEAPNRFVDERHMARIIENILQRAGRMRDAQGVISDLRLNDGSVVTITTPPNAANGPTITIRKPPRRNFVLSDLVNAHTLSPQMASFLLACVQARLNIVIYGDTATGKTTLLNALCACIPMHEFIVTIESLVELRLDQRQVVTLVSHSGPPASEQVTMRDLVLHAQRMHPGRLILGDCLGDEAADILQAMYMGQNGTLMAMYAHSIHDCLTRLETLSLSRGAGVPVSVIRTRIIRSLDLLIQVTRLRDGSYKVLDISEITAGDEHTFRTQSIFAYRDNGTDAETGKTLGAFEPSGCSPTFLTKFKALDISLPQQVFAPAPENSKK